MKPVSLFFAAFILTPFLNLHANDLKPAAIFCDHMVLQRDQPVPIWGSTDAGEKVTAEFADQLVSTTADATGHWMLKLAPLTTSAEPRELKITASNHADPLVIQDVLVGEVWLGSGQSNMVMTLRKGACNYGGVNDAEKEIQEATDSQIRFYNIGDLPHVGVISATDLGSGNIHPPNKKPVGERAALWALHHTYGQNIISEGPGFGKVEFTAGKAVVPVTTNKDGLVLKSPKGFELAGENQNFYPANAVLQGDTIVVTSPQVPTPVALRYAFFNSPKCTVYNNAGLPALPFRTDDWPVPPASEKP
jgi:hypothetical protein